MKPFTLPLGLPLEVQPRVHNKRREIEYPTSMILPNALCKVMT